MGYFKSFETHLTEGYGYSRNVPNPTPAAPRKFSDGDLLYLKKDKTYKGDYKKYDNSGPGCIVKVREIDEHHTSTKRWVYKVDIAFGGMFYESKVHSNYKYGSSTKTDFTDSGSVLVGENELTEAGVTEFLALVKKSKLGKLTETGSGSSKDHKKTFKGITIPAGTKGYKADGSELTVIEKEKAAKITTWAVDLSLLKKEPCYVLKDVSIYAAFTESSLRNEGKVSKYAYEVIADAVAEKIGLKHTFEDDKYGEGEHKMSIGYLMIGSLFPGKDNGIILKNKEEFEKFREDFDTLVKKYRDDKLQHLLDKGGAIFDSNPERFLEHSDFTDRQIIALAREAKIDIDEVKKKIRGADLGADLDLI